MRKFKMNRKFKPKSASKALTKPQKKAVAKIAQKQIDKNVENKRYDNVYEGTITVAGLYDNFADVGVGTANNQRIGNDIEPMAFDVSMRLALNSGSTGWLESQQCRVIAVIDTQSYASTALQGATGYRLTPTTLLQDSSRALVSKLNDQYVPTLKVLHDTTYVFTPQDNCKFIKLHYNKSDLRKIYYREDLTEPIKNNIAIFWYCSSDTYPIVLNSYSRLTYQDA